MLRKRMSSATRWMGVVALLGVTSAAASFWRPETNAPTVTRTAVNLVPKLFTASSAQIATTGCTGTPAANDPNLGGASGVLAIEMKSIKLMDFGADGKAYDSTNAYSGQHPKFGSDPALDNDNSEFELLSAATDLNFAGTSGTNVGNFVSNASVPAASYEALKITVNPTLRIKCAIVVATPGSCGAAPVGTYRTQGGSSLTSPDSTALPAQESSLTPSGAVEQAVIFPFQSDFNVTTNSPATKNVGYTAGGACELWSLGGGQFKIMPKSLSASIQ